MPTKCSTLLKIRIDSVLGGVRPQFSQDQFDETLNSLKYANRAKNIKPRDGLPIIINERESGAGIPLYLVADRPFLC